MGALGNNFFTVLFQVEEDSEDRPPLRSATSDLALTQLKGGGTRGTLHDIPEFNQPEAVPTKTGSQGP